MDSANTASTTEFRQWICSTCGWGYDEAAGAPDHDLPPGTRLQDIPDD